MRAVYNEIDPFAVRWIDNLIQAGQIAKGDVDARSIAELEPDDVAGPGQRHFFAGIGGWSHALRLAAVSDDASIWTGSCPCQPFSDAGKGLGTRDPRHLWPTWFALIRECRPAIVFGEQVASRSGLAWLDLVRSDLEGCGYAVGASDLCSASIGAPHIRQRLYWVAYSDAKSVGRSTHDLLVEGANRTAPIAVGGLPSVAVAGRWWSEAARGERLPTLVANHHGLSSILAGVGNAIDPQVAAAFVRAAMASMSTAVQ